MNSIPVITKNLLIINVLMFLGTLVARTYGIDLADYLGLHFFMSDRFNAAQLITYMFMHGGFTHVFFNMFAVWMFGRILEQVWGPKRFLFYYLLCGIGAGLIQEGVTAVRYFTMESGMNPEAVSAVLSEGAKALSSGMNFVDPGMAELNIVLNSSTVGASGAVYAILLGFGMLFPNERMFIFPLPMPIKAKYFVMGYALIELYSGLANNPTDNVAHFAHLGGMIFGFILIMYWRRKGRRGNGYYYN
ncbi:rhomboid family intramembrane serine protease [uncultured Bacteroides sp.]|jgi:membrane associated rhomboid family serine protease|uniref:rhomboid family intramembrane serine protease n=1 Tax=uncultured Bacteroides sp. TaxID=162156 RepID=UPI00260CCE03|nr:rhomboid family intramembrane serine protease [uncultured Bacteroides sp.]